MENTVEAPLRDDVARIFQHMSYHPHEPHWYLPMIGVDPAHQARATGMR